MGPLPAPEYSGDKLALAYPRQDGLLHEANASIFFWEHSRCRPKGESYAAASCVQDGPIQAHFPNIIVQEVGPYEDLA